MINLKSQISNLKSEGKRGIALYIAITVTGALVLVAFAIIQLALKQIAISSAGRDSQEAFYAADSGDECAIFWDVKNPTSPGRSAFATDTPVQNITCNGDSNNPANITITPTRVVGNPNLTGTSTFSITFLPNPYCATVNVIKSYNGNTPNTKIESRGYNTCDPTSLQRVERAIRVTY